MAEFTYWLQRADFTVSEPLAVSASDAWDVFVSYEWDTELEDARVRAESGAVDVCPPGIGYVSTGDGAERLLHIRPTRWDAADVSYFHPTERRPFLGLLPRAAIESEAFGSNVPIHRLRETIDLFFAGRHADLLRHLASTADPGVASHRGD